MYIDAAETAASSNVKLLVYPEGYGLVGSPSKTSFYEPLAVIVGSSPCGKLNASTHPIQAKLGCAAANYSIALGANLFTAQKNGSHYITEVIFSQNGTVLAIYHKHELFPIEEPKVSLKKPHPPKAFMVCITTPNSYNTQRNPFLWVAQLQNFVPGPFAPTVFQFDGRIWGIAICYEGFYPTLTGNWNQFDALRRQGADALVWSVGTSNVCF